MAAFLFNAPAQASTLQRVYLDESGTLGYSGELFTMAFVLVHDLPRLESSTLKHRVTQSEVKASQMKTAQKLALARTLLEENDIQVFLAKLDPIAAMVCERKLDKEFIYDSMVAQGMAHYLERGALPRDVPYRISMDMRGGLRESYEDMVAESVGNVLMHRSEPLVSSLDVRFLDSRYSAGVQAADLFSNIYRTALTQTDSPCTSFLRKFEEEGRVHTGFAFGLPELADQMTQIAADLRARVERDQADRSKPEGGQAVAATDPDAAPDQSGGTPADKAERAPEAGSGTSRSARRRRSRSARREREAAAFETHTEIVAFDTLAPGTPAEESATADVEPAASANPTSDGASVRADVPTAEAPHETATDPSPTGTAASGAGTDEFEGRDKPARSSRRSRGGRGRATDEQPAGTEPEQPQAQPEPEAGEREKGDEQPKPARLPFAPARDIRPGRSARMRQSRAAQKLAERLAAREQELAAAAPEPANPAPQPDLPSEAIPSPEGGQGEPKRADATPAVQEPAPTEAKQEAKPARKATRSRSRKPSKAQDPAAADAEAAAADRPAADAAKPVRPASDASDAAAAPAQPGAVQVEEAPAAPVKKAGRTRSTRKPRAASKQESKQEAAGDAAPAPAAEAEAKAGGASGEAADASPAGSADQAKTAAQKKPSRRRGRGTSKIKDAAASEDKPAAKAEAAPEPTAAPAAE